ncbi:hypothetical protein NHQ30_000783 [Ciborinia camelliae]|nr:hypothetical protein NHQ30_000783 [Ciborinia camelliae]
MPSAEKRRICLFSSYHTAGYTINMATSKSVIKGNQHEMRALNTDRIEMFHLHDPDRCPPSTIIKLHMGDVKDRS